ncbi:DnaQ DNA polymerase III, epsilon subunit and related 3'-5' exonucleases [Candidatus Nanopelagicaceae bacterium]
MSGGERLLIDVPFVVFDLETSGSAPSKGAAVTEIGAIKVLGGNVIGEFQTFVNPGHHLSDFITSLTGITDSMLADAPTIDQVLPTFLDFLGPGHETVLVAHNAPFDMSFMKAAAIAHNYEWSEYKVVDTALVARYVLDRDEVPNCKLSTLAPFFGSATSPNHRALDDARATVDVLHGIFERLGTHDVTTLDQLLQFKRKRARRPLD